MAKKGEVVSNNKASMIKLKVALLDPSKLAKLAVMKLNLDQSAGIHTFFSSMLEFPVHRQYRRGVVLSHELEICLHAILF